MARLLSKSEKDLWEQVTSQITPINDRPVNLNPAVTKISSPNTVGFNPVLDLHGMTLHAAYSSVLNHITTALFEQDIRYVTIITGLSGQIRDEFPRWLEGHPKIRSIESLRGGGAWQVWLRKNT